MAVNALVVRRRGFHTLEAAGCLTDEAGPGVLRRRNWPLAVVSVPHTGQPRASGCQPRPEPLCSVCDRSLENNLVGLPPQPWPASGPPESDQRSQGGPLIEERMNKSITHFRHVARGLYDLAHMHLCLFPSPVVSSLLSATDTCAERILCSTALFPCFDRNSHLAVLDDGRLDVQTHNPSWTSGTIRVVGTLPLSCEGLLVNSIGRR